MGRRERRRRYDERLSLRDEATHADATFSWRMKLFIILVIVALIFTVLIPALAPIMSALVSRGDRGRGRLQRGLRSHTGPLPVRQVTPHPQYLQELRARTQQLRAGSLPSNKGSVPPLLGNVHRDHAGTALPVTCRHDKHVTLAVCAPEDSLYKGVRTCRAAMKEVVQYPQTVVGRRLDTEITFKSEYVRSNVKDYLTELVRTIALEAEKTPYIGLTVTKEVYDSALEQLKWLVHGKIEILTFIQTLYPDSASNSSVATDCNGAVAVGMFHLYQELVESGRPFNVARVSGRDSIGHTHNYIVIGGPAEVIPLTDESRTIEDYFKNLKDTQAWIWDLWKTPASLEKLTKTRGVNTTFQGCYLQALQVVPFFVELPRSLLQAIPTFMKKVFTESNAALNEEFRMMASEIVLQFS